MKKLICLTAIVLLGCAPQHIVVGGLGSEATDLDKIKVQIQALVGTQQQLDGLLNSDFKTCDGSGDTVDALIKKICNVAQAANSEFLVELKSELAAYSEALATQLSALSTDVLDDKANINTLTTSITTINATLTSVASDIANLQSAVTTLQSQVASITGVLATNLVAVSIGEENLSAGPLYETVLKRYDSTRFNGYVEALSASVAVASGGYSVTNGSAVVTVTTSTAHGLVAGNTVRLLGATNNRGLLLLDVTGDFVVASAPTTTTFTYTSYHAATSTGTLGGSAASAAKFSGRGLGTLWKSNDVSDAAVRQTTLGSKVYNFIIRRKTDITKGELCYDKTNNAATFATINAAPQGGSDNVVCK